MRDLIDDLESALKSLPRIFFHLDHQDLKPGDHGVICSFGAGYSIGSLVVRKRQSLQRTWVNGKSIGHCT